MNDLATTEIIIKEKTCSKCGKTKPLDMFRHWQCRACLAEISKRYYKDHKEEHKERRAARARRYHQENIEKEKARWQKYSQNNREKINAHKKIYDSQNPKKIREYSQKYYKKNQGKCRESCRQYQAKNRDSFTDRSRRRRAIKRSVTIEKFSSLEIFQRDQWVCQICKKGVNRRLKCPHPLSKSLDHIIPLSRGGSHSKINVQLVHLVCNERAHVGGVKQLRLIA